MNKDQRSNSLKERTGRFPWKSLLATTVTIVVFALLFSKIDFYRTVELLVSVNPIYLLTAVVISVLSNILIPTEEWRLILRALGKQVSLKRLLFIKLGVAPIKNAGPLKSGELVRALCLKRMEGVSFSVGALSVFISLILGFLILFVITLAGCLLFYVNPYNIGYFSLMGGVGVLSFIVVFPRVAGNKKVLLFLNKFSARLSTAVKNMAKLLKNIRPVALLRPFFLGFIVKLSEILVFYFIFKGLDVDMPAYKLFVFVPVTMFVSIVPVAFFGMGIREGLILLLFSGCASQEVILGGGLLFSFVDYLLPAFTGGAFTRSLLGRMIGET